MRGFFKRGRDNKPKVCLLLESKTTRPSAEFRLACRETAISAHTTLLQRAETSRNEQTVAVKSRIALSCLKHYSSSCSPRGSPLVGTIAPLSFAHVPREHGEKKSVLRFLEQAQGSRNGRPLKESASGMIPSAQVPRQRGERKGLGEDELTQSFQQRARGPWPVTLARRECVGVIAPPKFSRVFRERGERRASATTSLHRACGAPVHQ